MHKILKKTIKYTACGIGVLLLAIILFVSILYFSADMLTPDYTPRPTENWYRQTVFGNMRAIIYGKATVVCGS